MPRSPRGRGASRTTLAPAAAKGAGRRGADNRDFAPVIATVFPVSSGVMGHPPRVPLSRFRPELTRRAAPCQPPAPRVRGFRPLTHNRSGREHQGHLFSIGWIPCLHRTTFVSLFQRWRSSPAHLHSPSRAEELWGRMAGAIRGHGSGRDRRRSRAGQWHADAQRVFLDLQRQRGLDRGADRADRDDRSR